MTGAGAGVGVDSESKNLDSDHLWRRLDEIKHLNDKFTAHLTIFNIALLISDIYR